MNRSNKILHIEGAWDIRIRSCLIVIGIVTATVLFLSIVSRMSLASKLKRKYAQRYREKWLKHKCRTARQKA